MKKTMSKAKYNYKRKYSRLARTKNRIVQVLETFIKSCRDIFFEMKKTMINRKAFYDCMHKLSSGPVECGGILLGPANSNAITHFYFDRGGSCTGNSYSPDHKTLNRKLRQQWRSAGLDIKGFAHSHPGNLDRLTSGDISYIKRLLDKNPQMSMFVAPIVLPYQKSIHPVVVSRDKRNGIQKGYFELF